MPRCGFQKRLSRFSISGADVEVAAVASPRFGSAPTFVPPQDRTRDLWVKASP